MTKMNLGGLFTGFLLVAGAYGQTFSNTGTTNIHVGIGPEASISVTADTTLTKGAGIFADFTGSTAFTYKVRTGAGATGAITATITTDFSTGPGPSVANSGTSHDYLTYTCGVGTGAIGNPCTTAQTASTSSTTPVIGFDKSKQTAKAGDSGSVSWTLVNDPAYPEGTYTAVATFSISAT
jgi:hypothetical protein